MWHGEGKTTPLSEYDQWFVDAWHKGSKPIAWMPLPEQYRESEG
jgi:hypothetical protein